MREESTETFRERSEAINVPVKRMVEDDSLELREIEPVKRSSVNLRTWFGKRSKPTTRTS